MKNILQRAWHALDNRDIHVYGGLVLAGFGGCVLSPAWTCIVIGGVLVMFGLFGPYLDRLAVRQPEVDQ